MPWFEGPQIPPTLDDIIVEPVREEPNVPSEDEDEEIVEDSSDEDAIQSDD